MQAIIEEATERTSDLKKEYNEFDRDVAKGSINHRNGRVYGEKVLRNFDDKMKIKVRFTMYFCLFWLSFLEAN